MNISPTGIALIQDFECCRLSAYADSRGVPTIGWGHTCGVVIPSTTTQDQADIWLHEDIATATNAITAHVTVALSQNQFDALTSFVYNVGAGAFEESTLLRKLNEGDVVGAANEFLRWDHSGKYILPSLQNRRVRERSLFIS